MFQCFACLQISMLSMSFSGVTVNKPSSSHFCCFTEKQGLTTWNDVKRIRRFKQRPFNLRRNVFALKRQRLTTCLKVVEVLEGGLLFTALRRDIFVLPSRQPTEVMFWGLHDRIINATDYCIDFVSIIRVVRTYMKYIILNPIWRSIRTKNSIKYGMYL